MAESGPRLTPRELDVLALLADGKTNKEIARVLGLSSNSIDKMLSNSADPRAIYPKIGVSNAKAAVTWHLQNRAALHGSAPLPPAPDGAVPETSRPPEQITHHVALAVFSVLCLSVILFVFIPFLADSEQSYFDSVFLNIYLVVPLTAGIYCLIASPRPVRDQRFMWAFRLFSVGLISWSVGALIYAAYDLLRGMEPHYPSLADLGFFSQTALQAISFAIWWRESHRRRSHGVWRILAVLLVLYVTYSGVVLSIRHIGQSTPTDWTIIMDGLSVLMDCASVLFAMLLLLPQMTRLLDPPMRRAMRLMSVGMVLMFAAGFAYFASLAVPESHWFYYDYGGWVDLMFLSAFCLFGLGLIDSTRCTRAFAEDALLPSEGVLQASLASTGRDR